MMRRLVCVWLPHWPITRLRSGTPGKPLVAVETVHGQRCLASVGPLAKAFGLYPGQTLTEARALCPDLTMVEADQKADAAALIRLAAWCERYTPLVATDPPDSLWLDITGCPIAETDRGERCAQDIVARLQTIDIPCRVAVAGTTGAAWAIVHTLAGEQHACVLDPGKERSALTGLPITVLRLDPNIVVRLRRVGLRTVEELLRLPRADLASRFGPTPGLRLDQALGSTEEAITWLHPSIAWQERLDFAEPISTPEDLAHALTLLTVRLCQRLAEQGQGAHRFIARFYRTDTLVPQIAVATASAVRDATHIGKLLREKLDSVDPGFGLDVITLAAEATAPLEIKQIRLDSQAQAQAADALAVLLDTLSNRLGADRLWRIAPRESHQPERRVQRAAPTITPAFGWTDNQTGARPIRLLQRPEPIEVTALLPDEPPVLFRWRRALHRVRSASGPERIAHEWWQKSSASPDTDQVRDYYRVEGQNGARFWVFRAGLHDGRSTPRWYLHGVFA